MGRQGKHFHTVSLLLPRAIQHLPQRGFKCTKLQFRRHPASHRPFLQTTGATFTLQKSQTQVNIFVCQNRNDVDYQLQLLMNSRVVELTMLFRYHAPPGSPTDKCAMGWRQPPRSWCHGSSSRPPAMCQDSPSMGPI